MDRIAQIRLLLRRADTCHTNAGAARRVSRAGAAGDCREEVEGLQDRVVRLHERAMAFQEEAFSLARRAVAQRGVDDPVVARSEAQLLLQIARMEPLRS